jgi:hypothetical protein
MLPGVLLQVIESPRAIYDPVDDLARVEWTAPGHDVKDGPGLVFEDVYHFCAREPSRIVRLAAARRVEGRPVQHYLVAPVRRLPVEHRGGELQ